MLYGADVVLVLQPKQMILAFFFPGLWGGMISENPQKPALASLMCVSRYRRPHNVD